MRLSVYHHHELTILLVFCARVLVVSFSWKSFSFLSLLLLLRLFFSLFLFCPEHLKLFTSLLIESRSKVTSVTFIENSVLVALWRLYFFASSTEWKIKKYDLELSVILQPRNGNATKSGEESANYFHSFLSNNLTKLYLTSIYTCKNCSNFCWELSSFSFCSKDNYFFYSKYNISFLLY